MLGPGSARVNPFTALGLPTRPDLTDEQVRAAWRAIAAATHPDRPDGGNVTRYTAAATAYAQLRTAWGRSEAYADLAAGQPYVPAPRRAASRTRPARASCALCSLIPARIRHGRPAPVAGPRHHRGCAVAARPAPGAGAALRARRRDRPDHVVRADRAGGSGPAAGPVNKP